MRNKNPNSPEIDTYKLAYAARDNLYQAGITLVMLGGAASAAGGFTSMTAAVIGGTALAAAGAYAIETREDITEPASSPTAKKDMLKNAFAHISGQKIITTGLTGAFALFMGMGGLSYAHRTAQHNQTTTVRTQDCTAHTHRTVTAPNGKPYRLTCP